MACTVIDMANASIEDLRVRGYAPWEPHRG